MTEDDFVHPADAYGRPRQCLKEQRLLLFRWEESMDLSIVIPAFEESGTIARDVKAVASFLQAHRM